MTSTQPLTASERFARSILTAWDQRALGELKITLTQAPAALPAEERERIDLLHGLGQDLLKLESTAAQNAALTLVRHLARCGQTAR